MINLLVLIFLHVIFDLLESTKVSYLLFFIAIKCLYLRYLIYSLLEKDFFGIQLFRLLAYLTFIAQI